jgi:hypothetical protein
MVKSKALRLLQQIDKCHLKEENLLVLELYLEECLSKKEIAIRLKQPVNSINKQLSQAMLELGIISEDPQFIKAKEILYGK